MTEQNTQNAYQLEFSVFNNVQATEKIYSRGLVTEIGPDGQISAGAGFNTTVVVADNNCSGPKPGNNHYYGQ